MAFTPLNALTAFLAVARKKSYVGAAKDLGVSTSALSQSVSQLELRLGVTLLARTSRSVSLTEAGERLVANAGPAIEQALEALENVSAARDEVTGRLRLSVPHIATTLIMPRLVPPFVARHPRVELDVRVENRFIDLVAGGVDAGIRWYESIDRDMVQLRVTPPGRFVVVGAPSYFARRGVPQKPNDLLRHDCLRLRFTAEGEAWPWELERGKKLWRVPVRGPIVTESSDLRRRLCIEGVGLDYAYEPFIAEDVAAGRLEVVLDAYASAIDGWFLYYPSRARVTPALAGFVAVAREIGIKEF